MSTGNQDGFEVSFATWDDVTSVQKRDGYIAVAGRIRQELLSVASEERKVTLLDASGSVIASRISLQSKESSVNSPRWAEECLALLYKYSPHVDTYLYATGSGGVYISIASGHPLPNGHKGQRMFISCADAYKWLCEQVGEKVVFLEDKREEPRERYYWEEPQLPTVLTPEEAAKETQRG